jgi:predicted ATPase with chaperone activity
VGRFVRTWERALSSEVGLELDQEGQKLLDLAVQRLGLSGWEVGNVREVALTIRRMDSGPGGIAARHVAEAIAYVPSRIGRR